MKSLFASISLMVLVLGTSPVWAQANQTTPGLDTTAVSPAVVAADSGDAGGHEAVAPTQALSAEPAQDADPDAVLAAALRVSGISLVVIFIVMGAFGGLISLLGRLIPARDED